MLSSRVMLSLAAVVFFGITALTWASSGMPSINLFVRGIPIHLYILSFLCLLSLCAWMRTFFRPRGERYLLSSRLLLSIYSAVFGICFSLVLINLGVVGTINFRALPDWQLAAYVSGLTFPLFIWCATYFRARQVQKWRGTLVPRPARNCRFCGPPL